MIEKYILISFIILIILIYLLNIIYYNKKKEFFDNNNKNNLLKDANWTFLILNDFKSELLNKNLKENYNTFMKEMIIFVDNYNTINNRRWWIFNIFQTKIEYLKNLSNSEKWINGITINFNNIFDFYLYNKKPVYIINEPKIINNKLILPPVFKDAPLPPFSNSKESNKNNKANLSGIESNRSLDDSSSSASRQVLMSSVINNQTNSNINSNLIKNNKVNLPVNNQTNSTINLNSISNNKKNLPVNKKIITYRPRQINNNNISINRPLNTPVTIERPRDRQNINNNKKTINPIVSSYPKDKNIITTTTTFPPHKFTTNPPIINTLQTQSTKNKPNTTPSPAQSTKNKPNTTPPSEQSINTTTPFITEFDESIFSLIEIIKNKIFSIINSFKNKKVITENFKINSSDLGDSNDNEFLTNNSLPKNKIISKDKKIIINGDKNSSITIPSKENGKYGNLNIHVNYNSENSVNHLNNNKTTCGGNNSDINNKLPNNYNNDSKPEYTSDNSSRIYTNKDWIYPEKCLNNSGCGNNYYNSTNYKNGYYNANDNNNFIQSLNNAHEDPITSLGNYNPINNYISPNSFYK